MIELVYSPWLIFLMAVVPMLYKRYNKFVNAELDTVVAAGERINWTTVTNARLTSWTS